MAESTGINIPRGFLFSVAEAAIKKPGRKDICLIVSETEADVAGVFTTNSVKAAPVKLCMKRIKSGKGRVIIANSGNANACTGMQGMKDSEEIAARVAKNLGLKPSHAFVCSTGVIGTPMPMERIRPVLNLLSRSAGAYSLQDVARAIMTTDTFPKMSYRKVKIGNKFGTISGICKGSGMIAPNMATMLCFLITDVAVEPKVLRAALRDSVDRSFNLITVDGDMSTNDTVLLMANGVLGNPPVTGKSKFLTAFKTALDEVIYDLARLVVKDGEGATKLIEVFIKGAKSESAAKKAAFAVADSSLVKTAIYGNDANWGRIMCALGYSGIPFREEKTDIFLNGVKVVKNGLTNNQDKEAALALKAKEILITIDLHFGKSSAKVLTCDLTEGYIRINAEYRT